jgi:hypothetical protein
MALASGNQVKRLYYDGQAAMMAVYVVRNVTAGDTVNLSVDFLNIKQAAMIGSTIAGSAAASVTGTTITIPAGPSGDSIYLMAWGDSAI